MSLAKDAIKYSFKTFSCKKFCLSLLFYMRVLLEALWISLFWNQLITIVYESVFHCSISMILFRESFKYFGTDFISSEKNS